MVTSFGAQPAPYGSAANSITDVGGTAFFIATDLTRGTELWKSDGTAAGTVLVKDILVGSGSSSPSNLLNVNGTLYFTANDGTSGIELWKSDGTATGTVLVKDIQSGSGDAVPDSLRNVNGTLLFTAINSVNGRELWKSNGTASGTVLVKDIRLGNLSAYPGSMTVVNGTLYFGANDGTDGNELWKSDGTEAGTVLVKDIFTGGTNNSSFYPGSLTNVNGTLYFSANDGTTGVELWKSNGTAAGTVLVKDIRPGSGSSSPFSLTNVNGSLLFTANDGTNGVELWTSDGTAAGTVLVKDILAGATGSSLTQLTAVNTTLFFRANDGTNGTELWKSDGTAAGTVLVKNIHTGNLSSSPRLLVNVNGTLFFQALDSVSGNEFWKSDGTAAGTLPVKDIVPGTGSSVVDSNSSSFQNPVSIVNVNGTAYFRATNSIIGEELWKSDGTPDGTILVRDIRTGNNDVNLLLPANLNGTLSFLTDHPLTGRDLWKSNGTSAGTSFLKHVQDPSFAGPVFSYQSNVNGTLYFNAKDSTSGDELWRSNGTVAGTVIVKDINPGGPGSIPRLLTNVNGALFFGANDGTNGFELWKSDGTPAGTMLVKDIGPGSIGGSIGLLTSAGGTAFFVANNGVTGTELWKSDGTPGGTALVKDIRPGSIGGSVSLLTSVGNIVYFVADDGVNGAELWRSDGTLTGTSLVKDIRPGSNGAAISLLLNVGGTAFFVADDGVNGAELWKSDGTLAGTSLVRDIRSGGTGTTINSLINVSGTAYFVADDGINGAELWKSDGTSAGTSLVKNIRPGSVGAAITSLTNANGLLYFSANDGVNGTELWQSDGTPSGTVLSFDFTGDSGSSHPRSMILIGDRLFVTATTETSGTGLYYQEPPNRAPDNIVIDASAVVENLPSGTVIGGLSSSDPDPGNTFTYTLASGTGDADNSSFEIVGNTLRTLASFNYELKSAYSIRVRTTDQGGLWYENSFLVTVQDVNETPVSLSLSNPFFSDIARPGTTIGQFTTTDPDGAGQFTYSFVAGSGAADNGLFQIIDDRLFSDAFVDADVQSSFSIRIRTTDSGNLFTEQSFTITLKTGVAAVVEDQIPGDGLNSNQESTDPNELINVSGSLYFVAEDGTNGRELWRMNSQGIPEIVLGPGGHQGIRSGHLGAEVGNLNNVNGTLYFTADDGVNGVEWWRIGISGTASMLEDAVPGGGIMAGAGQPDGQSVIEVNGQVFLTASSELAGNELWRINSSGIAELVENAVPGGGLRDAAGIGSNPRQLTNVNGTLYFGALDEDGRGQLWCLNNSEIAEIVNDNQPGTGFNGPDHSFVDSLFNHNGTLYFAANDGYFGTELFRVNSAGFSERVDDSVPYFGINQFGSSDPQSLTSVGGTLFFTATDGINGRELWRVNSAGIAEMVDDAAAGTGIVSGTTSFGYEVADLTNFAGTLYFEANDGTNGRELWSVTATGIAQLVEDSTPGGGLNSNRSSYPSLLTESGGTLFFSAMDSNDSFQLWRVNPSGTAEIVEDSIPGGGITSPSSGPQPLEMVNLGGTLYFHAFMNGGPYGGELWRVTGMGTAERVESLHGTLGSPGPIPGGRFLTIVNDTLYFNAFDPINGRELWRLNETGMGELVEDGIPGDGINTDSSGSFPYFLTNISGVLYFTAYDSANGTELRRINSEGVIELVEDAVPGGGIHPSRSSVANNLTNVAGVLYFSADDGVNGQELWRINSTGLAELVRTVSGSEIYPGSEGSYPEYLTDVNGTLYFQAQGGDGVGHELFRISNTGHAEVVEDAVPGGGIRQQYGYGSFPEQLMNVNGVLYFVANASVKGWELWRVNSSGIAELVEDALSERGIGPENEQSFPYWLTNANGSLYFQYNNELWRVNASGIAELVEDDLSGGGLDNSSSESYPSFLNVAGGTLYFRAADPINGTELWRIRPDGIAEIVENNIPGGGLNDAGDSYPFGMIDVDGFVYFEATSSENVSELWRISSGGIAEIVDDGVAGTGINAVGNAFPSYLTNVNGVLYFIADDGVNGGELWRVNSSGIAELVEDEIPGGGIHPTGGSAPENLFNLSGTLYFTADDGIHGRELWRVKSAGTAEMIEGVDDDGGIAKGSQDSYPYQLTNINGTLYFSANDGGLNGRELFRLQTNDGPADLNLSSSQIPENIPALVPLATFLTSDVNAGNTFQYFLVAGAGDTDNSQFQIVAGSLVSNTSLDFETRASYSIRVRSADQGGLWFEKALTITVADQPEGTSGNDAFVFTYSSSNVAVTRSTNKGPVTSLGTFPLSAPLTVFGFGGTDSLRVVGTAGNDVIQVNGTGLSVNGHTLKLHSTESLLLVGGAGNDVYQFDADTPLGLISLDETLGGTDTLDFSMTSSGVTANLGVSANQVINSDLTLNLKSTATFENLFGGSGNDLLTGNTLANILVGGIGDDVLTGGTGNDTYRFDADESLGSDSLVDSAGIDTVSFAPTSYAIDVEFSLSLTTAQVVPGGLLTLNSATAFENLTGGDGDDLLTAGNGTGNLTGNAGNDTLIGGSGISTLIGGAGDDSLAGGAGNDIYLFDADSPLGSDSLNDSVGTDTISFAGTSAGVSVSLGLTTIQTVNASLQLTLVTAASFDNLIGGDGDDQLIGNAAVNSLTGVGGNDTLAGGAGNDSYGFDTDLFLGSDTIEELSGGGTDTLTFSLTTTRTVTLDLGVTTTQTVTSGNLLLTLFSAATLENIVGGSFGNTLTGNSLVNSLTGGNGPDVLDGSTGNDRLNGGSGNDTLQGGLGNDTITGGLGDDLLVGGEGDDVYSLDADLNTGADSIDESVSGIDTLDFSLTTTVGISVSLNQASLQTISGSNSVILGSALTIENVRGGSLNDSITGNSLPNLLTGNGGDDTLDGANGDDVVKGGPGNDNLNGGDGNDLLVGEAGNDILNGGQQNDVFQFDADVAGGLGSDIVTDSDGDDVLDFALTTTLGILLLDLDVTEIQVLNSNLSLTVTAGTVVEIVFGTAQNDTIRGNAEDNVILGNSGNDILEGRAGRDVLIGGLGADVLDGGLDDDLLIAGRTTHDSLVSRLRDIRSEWTSVSTYADRVSALRTATGVTGVMLKAKSTVLNDGTLHDTLNGGAGNDWFFRSLDDVITDLFAPEMFELL